MTEARGGVSPADPAGNAIAPDHQLELLRQQLAGRPALGPRPGVLVLDTVTETQKEVAVRVVDRTVSAAGDGEEADGTLSGSPGVRDRR